MFKTRLVKILLTLQLLWASFLWIDTNITYSAPLGPMSPDKPALQQSDVVARDITFKDMEFEEQTLRGPFDSLTEDLRVPENWSIFADSYLELKMSYISNMLSKDPQVGSYATLDILMDGHLLTQHLIDEPPNQPFQLRVPLPVDLLNQVDERDHELSIRLDASFICAPEHRYVLTVYTDSLFHLQYQQLPAYPDLSVYPRPIYGGSLQQDSILFVLPQQPSQVELSSAAAIAAKLGQSIGTRLIISTTTDTALTQELAGTSHLVIVGTPDSNSLITKLTADPYSPIKLKPAGGLLQVQGPAQFPDDGVMNYKVTLTNNTTTQLNASALEINLPPEIVPLACTPSCDVSEGNRLHRPISPVDAGQTSEITFTVTISRTALLPTMNTAISLVGLQREPLNVVTWSTVVTGSIGSPSRASLPHLFVYGDQAVPEVDGVVQEMASPWNPSRLVVMVSGATQEGVSKASQALSTKTYFPGMSGQVALVRTVDKTLSRKQQPITDLTLADLDYKDKTVYGFGPIESQYRFDIPYGWVLTDSAQAVIKFRHAQVPAMMRDAAVSVLINDIPVRSVKLNESNEEGILIVPLAAYANWGSNRLTVVSDYEPDYCIFIQPRNYWFTVLNSSEIHLNHLIETPTLDLADYPMPYITASDLSDLLFVLPNPPGPVERLALLRLAAGLGDAAGGDGFAPGVIFDESNTGTVDGKHIIIVGRPSVSPILQRVNSALPQPFIPGTDHVLQTIDSVVFSILPGTEAGLIEQIPSIWNPQKALLIVTGTSDTGVNWSVAALTNLQAIRGRLQGNLATVRSLEVYSFDTRRTGDKLVATPPSATVSPSSAEKTTTPSPVVISAPTPLPTATQVPVVPVSQIPSDGEWRTQFGLAIIALLLVTGGGLGWNWWRRKRRSQ